MSPRSFAALAVATALVLVLAIGTYAAQNQWSQARASGASLFPGLAAQSGRIAKIEIKQGERAVTLARDKEAWVLADRAGYPAKPEPVRALLVKLAQAELVEPKTRSKDRYGLLELEDPAGKDAKSRLVRLLDDKDGVIAEAVVGKKRVDAFGPNKGGTYVRKPADAQTWLANTDLDVPAAVREWVQPNVFELVAAKIAGVTIQIAGEEPLRIAREAGDGGKHTLVGMPDGKKLKEGAGVDGIVRAISSIDLEDVRKLDPAAAGETSVVKVEGDGGLVATLTFKKAGEDHWLSISATGEGDAKKAADEILARVQGWEFKLPAGRASSILKRRADLFEAS